jgi:replication factor C subunit 1
MSQGEFHRLVEGVKGMVIGDMLDRTIRKEQEWGLMPSFGFMTCVYSTEKISESLGFPQFPSWLGKFSS